MHTPPRHAAIQPLEARRLLSVTLVGGTLRVTGTDSVDSIVLKLNGTNIRVSDNGELTRFRLARVKRIAVTGGAGADLITLRSALKLPATVAGDAGNDTVVGGGGSDLVTGGSGNDQIFGSLGDDSLQGDVGNDTLDAGTGNNTVSGGQGNDLIRNNLDGSVAAFGGGGDDSLNFADAPFGITLSADDTAAFASGSIEEIVGSRHADFIDLHRIRIGGRGVTIRGGAGNDTLEGTQADDLIEGGAGRDSIQGREGNDTLDGGPGRDLILESRDGTGNNLILARDGELDTIDTRNGLADRILTDGTEQAVRFDSRGVDTVEPA